MKKILIVTAHPSTLGKTHRIAEAYQKEAEVKGNSVTLLNVYAPENLLPFLFFETQADMPQSAVKDRAQQLIREADELVFVHPIWWGTVPGLLKNWIDTVFHTGFAFRYTEQGKVEKLLTGKTAKIFATCGAPAFVYFLIFFPFRSFWKTAVLGFCGVRVTDIEVFGTAHGGGDPVKDASRFDAFLETIRKTA